MRDFLLETDVPAPTPIAGRPFQSEFERVFTEQGEGQALTYTLRGTLYRDGGGNIRKDVSMYNPDGTTVRLIIIQDITERAVYMMHEESKSMVALPYTEALLLNSGFAIASHDQRIGERYVEGLLCAGYRGKRGEDRVLTLWVSDGIGEAVIEEYVGGQEKDVFRLFNINLKEPEKALFSVPTGYERKSLLS